MGLGTTPGNREGCLNQVEEKSLKSQAEEIIAAVEQDLQAADTLDPETRTEVTNKANALLDTIFDAVSDVDLEAAGGPGGSP